MALAQAKVPVIVTASIICFALGAAGGVFAMMSFGYAWKKPQGPPPGPPGGGGMPQGGMPFGKMPFGKMPFGKMPSEETDPKNMLAKLIVKLDQLSQKPLKIDLNAEQQKKVLEQLKGLVGEKQELSTEEATNRITSLLEILKDHKETLAASGFGPPDRQVDSDPLMDESTQKHLQSLQKRFAAGKTNP